MFQPSWIRITSCLTITKDNVDFKLVSLNVQRIRSSMKRKTLFIWLTQQKADIFLQDTYSTKEVEDIWNTQYNGKSFYSHGIIHSCGVMILIKHDLEFEVKSSVLDTKGRYILIDATVQGSDFLLVNIYALNKVEGQCEFFSCLEKMVEKLNTSAEPKIAVGGDFNVAIDLDMDCSGGNPTKKDSVKHIQDICLDFGLVDIWCVRNPVHTHFTWRQKTSFSSTEIGLLAFE